MAETGPTAEEVEAFLYLSGVHDADVADLGKTGALQRLCRSTAEFSALRRTLYLPGARDRGDEALRNFRQLREIMRARRQRHWAGVASSLASALHGVPALRRSNAIVRRILSFILGRYLDPHVHSTVCWCVAHGCTFQTVGVIPYMEHVRAVHAAAT